MDMYALGERIGIILHRMDEQDRKIEAHGKRLNLWSKNIRRFVLVLLLWTLVLIGMSTTENAAEFAAAVLRRLLMPS